MHRVLQNLKLSRCSTLRSTVTRCRSRYYIPSKRRKLAANSSKETYAFNFPSQYVEPPVPLDFPPLPTYFIPEHENVPKSQRGSPLIGLQIPTFPQHESNIPNRPRSSPSTFGPNTEPLIDWPSRPLPPPGSDDEESPSTLHQPTTPRPTPPTPTPRHRASSSISTLSELHNQRTGRQYAPIAPNPAGLRQLQQAHAQAQALKRAASEDEWESPSSKKKRSNPPSPQVEITEEDEFLLKLKDEEENLSWKEIVARFQTKFGKAYQVPALQMRHKRLRDRMRVWTDNDIAALKMAHEDWLSQRFNIIASKVS